VAQDEAERMPDDLVVGLEGLGQVDLSEWGLAEEASEEEGSGEGDGSMPDEQPWSGDGGGGSSSSSSSSGSAADGSRDGAEADVALSLEASLPQPAQDESAEAPPPVTSGALQPAQSATWQAEQPAGSDAGHAPAPVRADLQPVTTATGGFDLSSSSSGDASAPAPVSVDLGGTDMQPSRRRQLLMSLDQPAEVGPGPLGRAAAGAATKEAAAAIVDEIERQQHQDLGRTWLPVEERVLLARLLGHVSCRAAVSACVRGRGKGGLMWQRHVMGRTGIQGSGGGGFRVQHQGQNGQLGQAATQRQWHVVQCLWHALLCLA
jgi:hypothetical protein